MIKSLCSLILLLALLCSLSQPIANAQAPKRYDGNAWLEFPDDWKTIFVTGLHEGIALGHSFSIWDVMKEVPKDKPNPAAASAIRSYEKYDAYFTNVTVGQIQDGLDTFYKDFQNRRILIRLRRMDHS